MRIDRFSILPVVIALTAVVAACSDRPDNVLDKESMAALIADIHKGEGVIQTNNRYFVTDSAKRVFRQSIFEKHGVTSEQVYGSLEWYGYNVEKFDEVYTRAIEILEEELRVAQSNIGSAAELATVRNVAIEGDSVDVWPTLRFRRFAATMPDDYLKFDLASDRFWEKGDVYTLRAKMEGLRKPVTYVMAVDYFDGSRDYISRTIPGNGWHEVALALDSAKVAHQVYGYINYVPSGEVAFVDSVSLTRTRWGAHRRDLRKMVTSFGNGRH